MKGKLVRGILGLSLLALVAGCGEDKGPALEDATGTVTYNDTAVAGASISFLFEDGQMSTGVTDTSGKFLLTTGGREGAPVGTAKVTVSKVTGGTEGAPENPSPEDMIKMMSQMGKAAKDNKPKNELPEKYASPISSGLTAEVTTSANEFTFQLVD